MKEMKAILRQHT